MSLDLIFLQRFLDLTGLSVRSAYWMGEKILVGTNAGEIFEVLATDKEKPKTIVQVDIFKIFFLFLK